MSSFAAVAQTARAHFGRQRLRPTVSPLCDALPLALLIQTSFCAPSFCAARMPNATSPFCLSYFIRIFKKYRARLKWPTKRQILQKPYFLALEMPRHTYILSIRAYIYTLTHTFLASLRLVSLLRPPSPVNPRPLSSSSPQEKHPSPVTQLTARDARDTGGGTQSHHDRTGPNIDIVVGSSYIHQTASRRLPSRGKGKS